MKFIKPWKGAPDEYLHVLPSDMPGVRSRIFLKEAVFEYYCNSIILHGDKHSGTEIISPFSGRVLSVSYSEPDGYIVMLGAKDLVVTLGNLARRIYVSEGQIVKAGTLIGRLAPNIMSKQTYLSLEISYQGLMVNPFKIKFSNSKNFRYYDSVLGEDLGRQQVPMYLYNYHSEQANQGDEMMPITISTDSVSVDITGNHRIIPLKIHARHVTAKFLGLISKDAELIAPTNMAAPINPI